MMRVIGCFREQHDYRLVALAALICVLASLTAVNLLQHASAVPGGHAAFGSASLPWRAGPASGRRISSPCWPSRRVSERLQRQLDDAVAGRGHPADRRRLSDHASRRSLGHVLGGPVVAGGIAAMHYTGMAAFEIAGDGSLGSRARRRIDRARAVIGACALPVGLHGPTRNEKIGGAVLLTLAICSHHFTAMGAVSIIPDPSDRGLAIGAAGRMACGGRRRSRASRLSVLALAGLLCSTSAISAVRSLRSTGCAICQCASRGFWSATAKRSSPSRQFRRLTGLSAADLVGARLESCFPDKAALRQHWRPIRTCRG